MGTLRLALPCALIPIVSCVALTGASDLREDPCLGSSACVDGSAPGTTGDGGPPTAARDGATPLDPETGLPIFDVGRSEVILSGTGVAVGADAIATLIVKDASGSRLPRAGSLVVFTPTGGTSALDVGAVRDVGDGSYRVALRGVAEGTKVEVRATIDGAPLTTAPPSLRVVNPVALGLTFAVDAANADGAKGFGGAGCGGSGRTTWTDLSGSDFHGSLEGFADPPCAPQSGWNGAGTPEDPHRLTFDGVDDAVELGAVNTLAKQTVMALVRKQGQGVTGNTGTGGIAAIFPVVAKGTAEDELEDIDVNFFLGVTPGGRLGVDFEQSNPPVSGNNPLTGNANLLDGTWYMLAMTFDPAAASRVLYVNGAVDGSSSTTNPPSAGTLSRFVIGGSARTDGEPNGRFKGDIAIVRTYGRALGAAEIRQTCDAYSSRFGITTCAQ